MTHESLLARETAPATAAESYGPADAGPSGQGVRSLVSVVMPVRNEERHVIAAISSVLEQQVSLELLVVDGMSTDRTVELVRSIGDPRVRVLQNPARTIPAALNIGLAAARGEFVARVDAHARVNSSYLATGARQLEDVEVAAVGGIRIAVAETPTGTAIGAALASPFGVGNSINHYADQAQDTDHASFGVYRTAVAKSVGGWDERLLVNEDVDFDHRIALAGHRIRFDPSMKIYWQVRETIPDFARQYRRYGRGKAAMVRKNGTAAVRIRHLAAPALVAMLVSSALLIFGRRPKAALALVAPYGVALTAATLKTMRSNDSPLKPTALVGSFATMHLTWGLGFIEGLLFKRQPVAATARDPRTKHRRR